MKKITRTLLVASLFATTATFAQLKTPQPSPVASIEQAVGLGKVEVEYSRPGVKDRTIFGELISYGKMWRTGANASTTIEFSEAVKIEGKDVPAGKYALYTIPGEAEWTIVLHKNLEHWGVGEYKQEEDLARFTVKPTKLNDAVETLTIDFSHFTSNSAKMNLSWEKTKVSFSIETSTNEQVEKEIKALLIDGPGAGAYYSAAGYYLENEKDLSQALTWINTAVEKRPEAFWYVHQQAKILGKLGKKKEAIASATKSLEMAKKNAEGDYGYIANNEKLIKELKGK